MSVFPVATVTGARTANGAREAYWLLPAADLFERLRSKPGGLTSADAAARLDSIGPNTIASGRRHGIAAKIGKRFAEPLVAILLVAAAISGFTGDMASFAIILAVIGLSIVLDVVQEERAETRAEALRRSVEIHADVRRDGAVRSLPVGQIVPGDVVELRAGDLVPADGILIEGRGTHVNEALMTGEPYPVEKRVGDCQAREPADAFNALFAGTSVVNGEAAMLVAATGKTTRFGGIAAALAGAETPSAFERGLRRLGLLILRLTVFLVLFVLLVDIVFGRPALDSFLFAVALAVGLTPELLPMITTVTLSRGAIRMAAKRVVVKRLAAIHDLGAMDVLCTDKTGTLTEAKISLVGHPGFDGADSKWVMTLAAVAAACGGGIRSPLDQAIIAQDAGEDLSAWRKIDEVPFDFDRRCLSVLAEREGRRILILKGAPEAVFARASAVDLGDGQSSPLDETARAVLERQEQEQSRLGYRLLGIAWKDMPGDTHELRDADECDLTIAGFCVFVDPPKPSAAAAIARLAAAGVRVKVISGDHEAVVRHLVDTLRIPARDLLTGAEIAELTEPALIARVETADLFARVSPDQKTRIIRALQARGHTVGFIGDGVNDAPAIHTAEIGLSVDGATDIARSAADMILLAPDLGVLADGVEEGRRTFANILKYVRMGTSSNFGNMLSMALASLVLPFLPLLPVQILLNNLIYDLSETGIPFDEVDAGDLARPRAWNMRAILHFTLVMGALSSLFDLATFAMLLQIFKASAEQFRTAWFIESIATQILVIFVIRSARPAWASRAHPVLVASSLGALLISFAIVSTRLGAAFDFTTMPWAMVGAIAVLVVAYLASAELLKKFARAGA
ncbi:MAG TPA: magnesium-translocating P-type ATPase [Pseudolabrys sp.]|nr:magnesium-translocating P-type ATPase [Pseudolabrys sp.]